uniref:Uncharacterized protein n=1 Tax=Romanomermis culicivorax TaxID=13658 RepID=A0A915L7R0_ROMCU
MYISSTVCNIRNVIAKLCQSMSISEATPYDWEPDGVFHNELAFVNYPMMLMPLNVSGGAEEERTKYEKISHDGEKATAPSTVDPVGRTPNTVKRFSSLGDSSLHRSDASFGEKSQKTDQVDLAHHNQESIFECNVWLSIDNTLWIE